jgi:hypothetical protein
MLYIFCLRKKIQSHFPIQAWPDEGGVMPGRRLMTKPCDKMGEPVIIQVSKTQSIKVIF